MKRLSLFFCTVALALSMPLAVFAEDVKIGLMCPLTGKWASEGQDMQKIVKLLVDTANNAGGVSGNKIVLFVEDDAGDPRTAALAAQKLISNGVVAVIGTYGSAVTEASQNIIAEADVLQIGTGSTSIRLTEKGLPLFFRTCPRDDSQGRSAADVITKGGFKKVAILHDNSSYAKGLAEETRDILKKDGMSLVFFDALTPGERDYMAILTKLKATEADLVFYTGYYPELGMLLRQKKQMGWNAAVMGGDATNHPDLVKIAGTEAAKDFLFVSPPLPQDLDSDVARKFLEDFKGAHSSLPGSVWAVLAGDAYKVIESAIANGQLKSKDMAAYLKKLENFSGLTGELGFDEKGDRRGAFYRLYKVDADGRFVLQP